MKLEKNVNKGVNHQRAYFVECERGETQWHTAKITYYPIK